VNGDIVNVGAIIGDETEDRIAALYALHARKAGRLAIS